MYMYPIASPSNPIKSFVFHGVFPYFVGLSASSPAATPANFRAKSLINPRRMPCEYLTRSRGRLQSPILWKNDVGMWCFARKTWRKHICSILLHSAPINWPRSFSLQYLAN